MARRVASLELTVRVVVNSQVLLSAPGTKAYYLRKFILFLLVVSIATVAFVRARYGGGEFYPDLSTPPLLEQSQLEEVLHYPEPVGDLAISTDGRIFFTVHPESRPQGNKLLEWVAGAAIPYPSGTVQPHLFDTVSGITIDNQNNLWSIDHGKQGFSQPRLLAFDLRTGKLVHDFKLPDDIAPTGSFLRDLEVSRDGRYVIITDSSVWRKNPALIVYEVASGNARRVLESHVSVMAEDYLIQNSIRNMSFFGGLFTLKRGVNGLAIDAHDKWLYYAAINNSGLYRIPLQYLTDPAFPRRKLAKEVERYSDKPLSDGLSIDLAGNIYIADVEHNAISIVGSDRQVLTLVQSSKIRWASAVTIGPDGYLYIGDSAFPELVLETSQHIRERGPFSVFRLPTQGSMFSGK